MNPVALLLVVSLYASNLVVFCGSALGDILDAGAARTRLVNSTIDRPGQSPAAPGPRVGPERARGR
jgi:hypothetical protein